MEHTLGYDMKLFGYYMTLFGYDMILFFSIFKFQEISVKLLDSLINFGVTNQVPQVSFKLVVGDLMLVSLMSFPILYFVNYWLFVKLYMIMELKHSLSTVPWILYLSI